MIEDLLADVSAAVQTWETAMHATLLYAHPTDWRPDVLYAEWMQVPDLVHGETYYASVMNRRKSPEFKNGFSNGQDRAAALQDLLRDVEHDHGIVLDDLVVNRKNEYIAVSWHLPGADVRMCRRVPLAVAAVPIPPAKTEKGVA